MAKDKWLHFGVGIVIALVAGVLFDPLSGFALAVIMGAGKEIHDYLRPENNTADLYDFIATGIGGTIGALALYLIH
jgi:hypothetical protein